MMGKKGEDYRISSDLKNKARFYVQKYSDELGYIDLDRVIFVTMEGSKAKWLGKTHLIKEPMTLIPEYVLVTLGNAGMVGSDVDFEAAELINNVSYIIILNEDLIAVTTPDYQKLEDAVLLHELLHINESMDGLVKHDIEDFKFMLDTYGTGYAGGNFKEDDNMNAFIREAVEDIADEAAKIGKENIESTVRETQKIVEEVVSSPSFFSPPPPPPGSFSNGGDK